MFALLAGSCGKNKDGFEVTKSGLKYKFIEKKDGTKPALGDIMVMHINYRTSTDSLLFDSGAKKDSFTVVLVEPTFQGGVEEGFAMMGAGDSAIFRVTADSIFEKTFSQPLPATIVKGSTITFQVRIKEIIPQQVHDSLLSAMDLNARREEFAKLEKYLEENKMDVTPTENGAYMLTTKPGSGEFPRKGDTLVVHYTGKLIDGTPFDGTREKGVPFRFALGAEMVIPGWEECLPLMNKGAKAKMVIPSDLGFGGTKHGILPAYSTLVFEVEVLDIIPVNNKGIQAP